MTTEGVEETTVVTAMAVAVEQGLVLAVKTTACFWVGVLRMEVEPSLDTVALFWDLDKMLGTKLELGEVVTMITWKKTWFKTWLWCKVVYDGRDQNVLTFCVAVLVVWMVGLVKVILTGDRCGGSELAMLCMMLLILGLLLMGTVMFLDTCGDTLVTSFSITGDELDELVRLLLRGFSSSSEQLTP